MTTSPRYTAAEAAYVNSRSGETTPVHWGVLDNETGLFAPFGSPSRDLAEYAAERIAANPNAGWTFVEPVDLVTEEPAAPRFEWTGADYLESGGYRSTGYGAVDHKLGRFFPFSDDPSDPDGSAFTADVAANPHKYAFATDYTITK
ncbi:membrane protein [Arthrobacter phage Lizalica]|uniref:Uncharacterized protein n=1 Tax=Arthrobacter phage Lizalica TaxID=2832319 RepID=A0AA48Y4X9_9CAUD|nr:membrane protein [Arthrobacter phage Lizalica]UIW13537.1 hypothetical protein SEA_LIZALICA_53 [Arthrobacter phage Lizalica]